MESKWRYNIAEMGMSRSNWLLAARLLAEPEIMLVQVQGSPNQKYQVFYAPDPDLLPVALNLPTPIQGHFPWGELVESD